MDSRSLILFKNVKKYFELNVPKSWKRLFQDFGIFNSKYFFTFLKSMSDLESKKHIFISRKKQDSLGSAALRHIAPRFSGWALLPSAAKKRGLHFSRLHLILSHHVICVFKKKFEKIIFLKKRNNIYEKNMKNYRK